MKVPKTNIQRFLHDSNCKILHFCRLHCRLILKTMKEHVRNYVIMKIVGFRSGDCGGLSWFWVKRKHLHLQKCSASKLKAATVKNLKIK